MKIYLDDDSAKTALVARLRKAGHQVSVPADVSLSGSSDQRHLAHAVQNNLVILTRNHDDFEDLHFLVEVTNGQHTGILAVLVDNDPTRDMNDADIARAIRNLERSGVPVANEFHILNHWQ